MRLVRHAGSTCREWRVPRGLALPLFVAGVGLACSATGGDAARVTIAPSILFPQGVLDKAQTLDLTVYAQKSGVACDTAGALPTGVVGTTPKIATQSLGTTSCTGGAKFCGTLTITKSTDVLVFAAQARDASNAVLANGCATATVNQDTLAVAITMQRFVTPSTCGNGVIEATEQCDPPGTAGTTGDDGGTDGGSDGGGSGSGSGSGDIVCDSQCHSVEEILSTGVTSPAGPAFFLWPAQSGTPGELLSFFTAGSSNLDVALRVMSDALEPVSIPPAASQALLAPNGTGVFPPTPAPNDQSQPSATLVNGVYYYAAYDTAVGAGDPDISLHAFDSSLADVGARVGINGAGGAGEPNEQVFPAIAANGSGVLFIAWQDVSGPNTGQIVGRTYDPSGADGGGVALGTENVLSTGTNNENVRLGATATGWIAVWDDGTQIKMRVIATSGTPSGGEIIVNGAGHTGDHPGIAVLGDGRAAVVWADHAAAQADVFVQRYDANLSPVANDQATAINDVVNAGDQLTPAIAGSSAAGGSFVAAWIDSASGDVRARVLGAAVGFLFNPIDGQTTEFKASLAPGVNRKNPTVAIGGAGPWIAIGWDDGASIYARRFPTSTE